MDVGERVSQLYRKPSGIYRPRGVLFQCNQFIAHVRRRRVYRCIDLTKREAEILSLVALGKSNKEIASALNTAQRTVEQHLTNSYRKLNVYNRTEAALAFLRAQGEFRHVNSGTPLVGSHDRL